MARSKYSKDFKQQIVDEYVGGSSINQLKIKYQLDYDTIKRWLKGIPDNNTGRFYQKYEIFGDYAYIYVKYHGDYKLVTIDAEDVEKCKQLGIWSIDKNGYISNCKTRTYLHRFVMDAPKNVEVDHIYHDLLDCRKQSLRLANSSQQKMNTHLRKDNISGHRGVSFEPSRNKWVVRVQSHGKLIRKRFASYEDACSFCDEKLAELHQDFRYRESINA